MFMWLSIGPGDHGEPSYRAPLSSTVALGWRRDLQEVGLHPDPAS